MVEPEVLLRNLKWTSDAANYRVARGEITDAQARDIVARAAEELTHHIDVEAVREDVAWEYAEVFRTARMWDKARVLFERAVRNPKNDDRRVNDNLRLAQVLGYLNEVDEAIKRASSVLDAPPQERAPFMPALTLEVVPACRGKGRDRELADLLARAIPLYKETIVDPQSVTGAAFLMAQPFHIKRAERLIAELRAGRPEDKAPASRARSVK